MMKRLHVMITDEAHTKLKTYALKNNMNLDTAIDTILKGGTTQ